MRHKFGFTLAETLITLTIIGVVSAITLPTVVGNYEKKVVGVKLHKFYSQMNQALNQYYKDNNMVPSDMLVPANSTTADTKTWWEQTIGPQFSGAREFTSTLPDKNNKYCLMLKDETAFCIKKDTGSSTSENINIHFYTEAKYSNTAYYDGKHGYLFVISGGKLYASVPSIADTTRAALLDSCKKCNYANGGNTSQGKCHTCSRLIQIDGWELKSDYPWKKECVGSGCS